MVEGTIIVLTRRRLDVIDGRGLFRGQQLVDVAAWLRNTSIKGPIGMHAIYLVRLAEWDRSLAHGHVGGWTVMLKELVRRVGNDHLLTKST